MWQHDLFEPDAMCGKQLPEAIEVKLVALLAQLILSALNPSTSAEENNSNEPN